jgi:hypothetical protein
MTGRAAGYCAGYGVPGYANPVGGRGFAGWGRGRGGGRGYRHGYWATGLPGWARAGYGYPAWGGPANPAYPTPAMAGPSREQELEMLRGQAEHFETALSDIKQRIEQLEADAQK